MQDKQAYLDTHIRPMGYKTCHLLHTSLDATACADDCKRFEKGRFAKDCRKRGGFFKCCIRRDAAFCHECRWFVSCMQVELHLQLSAGSVAHWPCAPTQHLTRGRRVSPTLSLTNRPSSWKTRWRKRWQVSFSPACSTSTRAGTTVALCQKATGIQRSGGRMTCTATGRPPIRKCTTRSTLSSLTTTSTTGSAQKCWQNLREIHERLGSGLMGSLTRQVKKIWQVKKEQKITHQGCTGMAETSTLAMRHPAGGDVLNWYIVILIFSCPASSIHDLGQSVHYGAAVKWVQK